jgi:hypothetical protein
MNNNFDSLVTAQKGNIGEDLVDKKLFLLGYQTYKPSFNESHKFDRLIFSKKTNTFYISDIKTKPSRKFFPDTGIDVKHFNTYMESSKNTSLDFLLLFVDELSKTIYGNTLKELTKISFVEHNSKTIEYPLIQKGIIYFPLEKMIKFADLTDEEANIIWNKTTMNKEYQNIDSSKLNENISCLVRKK